MIKPTTIRKQFLITINVVLILVFFFFGISFWSEWGRASKKHTEEIRQHSIIESNNNLFHGLHIFEGEIKFQIRQMERLAENFGRSDEFRLLVLKNRLDPLRHQFSVAKGNNIFDFITVLNTGGDIIASYPNQMDNSRLEARYKSSIGPVKTAIQILSGEPQSHKDRISSSYSQITREMAAEMGIQWQDDKVDVEIALLTVANLYNDFGDPVGVLMLGKLFRTLSPLFNQIKERTQIDYALYTRKYSNVTTGLHPQSPFQVLNEYTFSRRGPDEGTYFLKHYDGNLLCRELVVGGDLIGGLGCTGMSIMMASQSSDRIEDILRELKSTIGSWYVFLGTLALVSASILSYFLIMRLTNPLETVTHAIEKLAQNELDIVLPDKPGSREIRTISRATEVFKRNIQARSEIESRLRDQKEAALMSSRVKSQFLGNMGHDLRTPLNAIIGFSEVLGKEIFGRIGHQKYLEYANDINFSGKHLLELINNILDISSIESGKFTMTECWFDLPEVVGRAIRLHQFLTDQSSVSLTTHIDENISQMYGDPLRFQQILNNLISNAIKFTPSDGKVMVQCLLDDYGNLEIKVDDTGSGIPDMELEKIFEPFFLGDDKAITPKRGTGLGLFLVKSFVEFHNGLISVESHLGKGTSFTLIFYKNRLRTHQKKQKKTRIITS